MKIMKVISGNTSFEVGTVVTDSSAAIKEIGIVQMSDGKVVKGFDSKNIKQFEIFNPQGLIVIYDGRE